MEQSYVGTTNANLSRTVFTWKIDAFSYRNDSTTSPTFTDEKNNVFCLEMHPNHLGEFIGLDVYPSKIVDSSLEVKFKLFLVDSHGKRCLLVDTFGKLTHVIGDRYTRKIIEKITIPQLISRDQLFKFSKGYLPEDTLTIQCEIIRVVSNKKYFATITGPTLLETTQKIMEDYGRLLKSANLADVKLLVGDKTFSAHKSILAARSSVFAAMFAHDTKEKMENQVEIPEVNPEAFEAFLSFIYTGALPTLGNVKSGGELLVVSDKYDCAQLKDICEEYLTSQLTIDTAPNLLLLANSVNATKLKEKLLQFIPSRGNELFAAMKNEPEQMINMFGYLAKKNDPKPTEETVE